VGHPTCGSPWSHSFCASGDLNTKVEESLEDQNTIILKGLLVDEVQEYCDTWNPNWLEPLDRIAALSYLSDVRALCRESALYTDSNKEDSVAVQVAVARNERSGETMLVGQHTETWGVLIDSMLPGDVDEVTDEKKETVNDSSVSWETEGNVSSLKRLDLPSYTERLRRMSALRPFLSAAGRVGLAPPTVQAGDRVCIFLGGRVPYIIRPCADKPATFNIVGEAYVHGIMYGEVFEDDTERKIVAIEVC
jgi:hypothetical protein